MFSTIHMFFDKWIGKNGLYKVANATKPQKVRVLRRLGNIGIIRYRHVKQTTYLRKV